MDAKTLLALIDDVSGHKWLPLAVVVISYLVSLTNDWSKFPVTVPDRWKPVVALALGQAYAVLSATAGGTPWKLAVRDGVIAAFVTMGAYDVVVKALYGDKPIPRWLAWLSLGKMDHPAIAKKVTTPPPPPAAPPPPA